PCPPGSPTEGLFEGSACDDLDATTTDDTVNAECECVGIPIPLNDEVCGATIISCGEELTDLTFIGASQSIDDACFGTGTADLWFNFTSDGTETLVISETSGSDVIVELYEGTACDTIVSIMPCDDFPEEFVVEEAGNYYFRVRPYST